MDNPETRRQPRAPHDVLDIASHFTIPHPVEAYEYPGKGNINQQTYRLRCGPHGNQTDYLLQLLNPEVFSRPAEVMEAMTLCLRAQETALSRMENPDFGDWRLIRLAPAENGWPFYQAPGTPPHCWRMMEFIRETQSYKSLRAIPDRALQLRVAEEAGRGLGIFGRLTAGMDPSRLNTPLPGYRDTGLYYRQLHSILAHSRTAEQAAPYLPADVTLRRNTERHFLVHLPPLEHERRRADSGLASYIALALKKEAFARTLSTELAEGRLKTTAIHGDTKLENFLFHASTHKVCSLVDLDTIMAHTWLSDWGDMIRSLANTAGERETDPAKIQVDTDICRATARGFLSMRGPLESRERELLAAAPQIMALELGVRFLTDYLRGDSYFQLRPEDPADLNRTRAIVQFRTYEELGRHSDYARM